MAENAGKNTVIKISGTASALLGEPTTSVAGNLVYQITDADKQVLDYASAVLVLKKGTNDAAESGTNTTNIKMTGHGLVTGDVIINTTRSNAKRSVTRVDADNVTVLAVTGQTTSDTIEVYKTEASTAYVLSRLCGKVTYPSATARVILISGMYFPMSVAAYASSASVDRSCKLLDQSYFGMDYVGRIAGGFSASGSLNDFDVADTIYSDALMAGNAVVVEIRDTAGTAPDRFYALLENTSVKVAVESLTEQNISWQSTKDYINKGG